MHRTMIRSLPVLLLAVACAAPQPLPRAPLVDPVEQPETKVAVEERSYASTDSAADPVVRDGSPIGRAPSEGAPDDGSAPSDNAPSDNAARPHMRPEPVQPIEMPADVPADVPAGVPADAPPNVAARDRRQFDDFSGGLQRGRGAYGDYPRARRDAYREYLQDRRFRGGRRRGNAFPVNTAIGAGIGAIVGHQRGRRGRGALVGSGIGLLFDLARWTR
ncbi:MAG: hypothetical protein AB8H80_00985 [Planctomycetota bacterium]